MEKIKITLALSHYDRHLPFFDGTLPEIEGIEIQALQVGQSTPLKDGISRHERMLNLREFDAAEVSLSSYIMAKSRGFPFTAIPVFPRRLFSQSRILVRADSPYDSPADLIGKKVGLSTFQTTLSVLAKGDLKEEYQCPWEKIIWYVNREETIPFRAKEQVEIRRLPPDRKIGTMLLSGELDALIMPHPPKEILKNRDSVRCLFPDAKREELNYFRKNGYYPIMHIIALREELATAHPFLPKALLSAFREAKKIYESYYDDPNWSQLVWGRQYYEEEKQLFGADPWPLGLRLNRPNLERFLAYMGDQGLLERPIEVDELFHPTIVACSRKKES